MSQTSLSPQCSINDGAEFKAVADAMKVIGFKQEEIQTVYRIVAAILHLVSAAHGMVFRRAQIHLCSQQLQFSCCRSSWKIRWPEKYRFTAPSGE